MSAQVCWVVDVFFSDRTERLFVASQMHLLILSDDVICPSRPRINCRQNTWAHICKQLLMTCWHQCFNINRPDWLCRKHCYASCSHVRDMVDRESHFSIDAVQALGSVLHAAT